MAQPLEELKKTRLQKLEEIRKLGLNPYPAKSQRKQKITEALVMTGQEVSVAGRIMAIRGHGGIRFFDLRDESGKIQLVFKKDKLSELGTKLLDLLDLGDFIDVQGEIFKTEAGEVSVLVSDFHLLSKSIRPLPSQWFGLKDVEDRYRKRYLDLIFNPEVRKRFDIRTKLVREIRSYLDGLGFYEVETPVLQPLYGGANAKPFITHLNALDVKMYLRIADELYLKKLLVGGYEKVYEISKDFRNEGFDQTHNPEFTMIEYYEAHADYQRVMDVTEGLFKHLAKEIYGDFSLEVNDKKISIADAWPRVKMVDLLKEKLDLDVEKESRESLTEYCRKNSVEMIGGETKGQLIYLIFEHKVTDLLINPVWVIDYPKDVSPLSKQKTDDPEWVERFEGYVGGKEICDGWSELTDPVEQRKRFEQDVKAARKDAEEAQQVDEDFLEAMEYGMPPIGGIGIGIDRLAMFFTNTWAIKEVMVYPTLRPVKREEGEK